MKNKIEVIMRTTLLQKLTTTFSIASLLASFAFAIVLTVSPHIALAAPNCAKLDQGAVACPSGIPNDSNCYFYDAGNPNAGTIAAAPGWQKADCSSDIFKEASCVGAKASATAACKGINSSTDSSAINCQNECDLTYRYIDPFVNALAALVGVVIVGSIIYGGIQYSSSGDDPQKVSQAKQRIINALVALVAFFFLYAFIEYLLPGGIGI